LISPFKVAATVYDNRYQLFPKSYDEVSDEDVEIARSCIPDLLVPEDVAQKIYDFLRDNNILKTRKVLLLKDFDGNAAASSVKYSYKCINKFIAAIKFNNKLISEMKENLTDKHKFIIGHEAAHILNGDIYGFTRLFRQRVVNLSVFLPVYFITSDSLITAYFFASVLGYSAEKIFQYFDKSLHDREIRADIFSASLSPEIAKAGIEYLQSVCEKVEKAFKEAYKGKLSDESIKRLEWDAYPQLAPEHPHPLVRVEKMQEFVKLHYLQPS
jgi:Zn-dependent protease with chaperone function